MNIFVMKFGGDCLSTPKNQEKAKEIINSFEGKKIVVCSAMGRDGFPYSTSNLNKMTNTKFNTTLIVPEIIKQ